MTDIQGGGYGHAFDGYWSAGWRGVIWLPARAKKIELSGYTGYSGAYPSYADVHAWADEHPGANVALRLPEDVVGIDVDAYDGKSGADTLAHAELLWGTLPPTVRSTARSDGVSGIRLYRVPPGTHLETQITFPERQLGNIEVIQYFHRYCVSWPSLHRDTGDRYRWLHDDGTPMDGVPRIDQLPELPQTWIDGLGRASSEVILSADVQEVLSNLRGGDMDEEVKQVVLAAIGDMKTRSQGSRHDKTAAHVARLLRLNEQGHTGVAAAQATLRLAFLSAVGPDRKGDASSEYDRFWTNSRIHDLIASTPTVDDYDLGEMAGLSREQVDRIRDPFGDDFWSTRPALQKIRQWAMAKMAAPWGVLGIVLARVLATVPPWAALPDLVGGEGSLNFFVAAVGKSGGGKSVSMRVAAQVYPGTGGFNDHIHSIEIGSGEGIATEYKHRITSGEQKGELEWHRRSVLFTVPEVDMLTALGNRSGATLMATLRKAWSGEALGNAYRDADRRIPIEEGEYRLCLVLGVQPGRAGPLFDDADGGTPQRFLWVPVTDPAVSRKTRPEVPEYPIQTMPGKQWPTVRRDAVITLPAEAEEAILDFREAVVQDRDGVDPLDGHALLLRAKVAAALAVLDGRRFVNLEDWELAGTVMDKSDETRRIVQSHLHTARREEIVNRGRVAAIEKEAEEESTSERQTRQCAQRIVTVLREQGPLGGFGKHVASRLRASVDDALRCLQESGLVREREGKWELIE